MIQNKGESQKGAKQSVRFCLRKRIKKLDTIPTYLVITGLNIIALVILAYLEIIGISIFG